MAAAAGAQGCQAAEDDGAQTLPAKTRWLLHSFLWLTLVLLARSSLALALSDSTPLPSSIPPPLPHFLVWGCGAVRCTACLLLYASLSHLPSPPLPLLQRRKGNGRQSAIAATRRRLRCFSMDATATAGGSTYSARLAFVTLWQSAHLTARPSPSALPPPSPRVCHAGRAAWRRLGAVCAWKWERTASSCSTTKR